MRSEADVRGTLTRALRANSVLVQPIESPLTGLGIPDLFVRTSKVSAWVELKFERREPKLPYMVSFRDGQYGWLKRHWELGGISVLGVWTPSGLYCWTNASIQVEYLQPLIRCNFKMTSINGRGFIDWLDSI